MSDDIKRFSQAYKQVASAVRQGCFSASDVAMAKRHIQDSYSSFAHIIYDRSFLNWGLNDNKILNEFKGLDFNFSTLCPYQDLYSPMLVYYLIRPLIKIQFFNKRLLEVGCGNGIGLRFSSELLKTSYALGVDLVHKLAVNSNSNFYKENKVNYIQSDAEHIALEDASFDIITNLESSHTYPQIEHFFSEVERVLSPGGFFCYSDLHFGYKLQTDRLEAFLKTRKNLKIIVRHDITKMVQSAIYHRLIVNEEVFYRNANAIFGNDREVLLTELPVLARTMGLLFLPWWKKCCMRFKNPELDYLTQFARHTKYNLGKKYYYYYLIQKGSP